MKNICLIKYFLLIENHCIVSKNAALNILTPQQNNEKENKGKVCGDLLDSGE